MKSNEEINKSLHEKKEPTDHEVVEAFRKELHKIMPGYKWTIHKTESPKDYIRATGIISSGFNRLSTLEVVRRYPEFLPFHVRSSGFGAKSPWFTDAVKGNTLAQALRHLQRIYEYEARKYSGAASYLQDARIRARAAEEVLP